MGSPLMNGSLLLCLGSITFTLAGLLLLAWGARRERWHWVWVLLAAVLLIGAAFGAAETVYQIAVETEAEQQVKIPVSGVPTALPSPTATSADGSIRPPPALPAATMTPSPPPATDLPPSPASRPTSIPADPALTVPDDVASWAASLIPDEQGVLASLDDPPRYHLDVAVDFDALAVAGTAQIHYTNNTRDTLDAIYLRLYPNADHYKEGATEVDAVTVGGDAAAFTFEDAPRTILKVPLSPPLAPDEQTTLRIAFAVTVPRRSDRFGYDQGVMSLGHWYPMLAVYDDEGWNLDPYVPFGDAFYSDVAFYTVRLTVPDGVVVAASGVEVGRVLRRPPRTTTVYASGATRDFALALSREYETISARIEDTTVTSYYLPGHERGGQRALHVAAGALEAYNLRFGRYPYTELDVAETSFTVLGAPGGMEFPGIIFISSEFYRPRGMFASELDVVVAHEVAHQWWYGVVGNNQVDEPWLDEAFATYASIVYAEDKQDPRTALLVYWSQAVLPYQLARMVGGDGPVQSSLLDYRSDLIIYQSIVYSKGALFLAQLRELLGDDSFFALLQQHFRAHKYGLLAPDDFRRSIQEATGNAAALALYDAIVVRGEPIEGLPGLQGFEGLLGGGLSQEDLDGLMRLLEQLLSGAQS